MNKYVGCAYGPGTTEMIRTGKMTAQKPYPAERMTLLPVESPSEPFMFGCVRQVLQNWAVMRAGHAA
ncbi:hypothetical protein GOA63_29520 [Sinorhizobium meliloti]|uniref:hypothetical protein n=1 Tax=Rhizobium meliloti TaxID=382 RepID=UPI000FD9E348|nr:hypothetical protein [Sinorhizobium meliloti]MDW9596278.1 hypothetical protein [Sinorhizobium meliloti]MDX0191458.1 hypothetical protein [Sinorhizobium meliloti]RVO58722.1 hypothetical protein CN087_32285 [Sinorhizobium meliloti]